MNTTDGGTLLHDMAWSGSQLVVADPGDIRKIRRPRLSPSVASSTLQCPAQMAASRLLPQPSDPFGPRELGSACHAVLEAFYTLPADGRTREALARIVTRHADTQWATGKLADRKPATLAANRQARQTWQSTVQEYVDGIFTLEDPATVDVIRTEWKIEYTTPPDQAHPDGIPSRGTVDRLDRKPDGSTVIYDYKFADHIRTPRPGDADDYGDQQRLYALAVRQATGVRPAAAILLYPRVGKARVIDLSDQATAQTLARYGQAWDDMHRQSDAQRFDTHPSALCAWCPLANSCPVARIGVSRARDPEKRQAAIDKSRKAAASQPSRLQLGIATIPPGAPVEAALDGNTHGVTVPPARAAAQAAPSGMGPVRDTRRPSPAPAGGPNPDAPRMCGAAGGQPPQPEKENPMSTPQQPQPAPQPETPQPPQQHAAQPPAVRAEGPSYQEVVNGRLNLNSFSAMAVCGIVSMASDHLARNGQTVTVRSLTAMSDILAGMVLRVGYTLTGQASYQSGVQTRLRGLLHAHLADHAAPFGQPEQAWTAWMAGTERYLGVAMQLAESLYERRPVTGDAHLFFTAQAQPAPAAN